MCQELADQAGMKLLSALPKWRLRAVERVELSSALWSERHREIHVRPLKQVMEDDETIDRAISPLINHPRSRNVDLILPITELPKVPLLDLSITVAGTPVYRASKDEGARIQARYVIDLIRKANILPMRTSPAHLLDFLTFTFYHPSHPYEKMLEKNCNEVREAFYDEFLDAHIPIDLSDSTRAEWKRCAATICRLSGRHVIHDYLSGAEIPIIGIPYFLQEINERNPRPAIPHEEEITCLLKYLRDVLVVAQARRYRDPAAQRLISTYFAYGYRWMAFARCTVPLNKSFIISTMEKRAVYFTPRRVPDRKLSFKHNRDVWQMVPFCDAETNHVSIRVPDTAVRLHGYPQVFSEAQKIISGASDYGNATAEEEGRAVVDEEANTFELYLRQDSTRSRAERIFIKTPLRLTRLSSWMLSLTMAITGFATVLLTIRGVPDLHSVFVWPLLPSRVSTTATGLTAKDATLILVPVAFAASLLLARDGSTLSARIKRVRQSILTAELFLLLTTAFILLLIHHVKVG